MPPKHPENIPKHPQKTSQNIFENMRIIATYSVATYLIAMCIIIAMQLIAMHIIAVHTIAMYIIAMHTIAIALCIKCTYLIAVHIALRPTHQESSRLAPGQLKDRYVRQKLYPHRSALQAPYFACAEI